MGDLQSLLPAIQVTDYVGKLERKQRHTHLLSKLRKEKHVDTDVSNLLDWSDTGFDPTPFGKDPAIDCGEHC